MTYSLRARCPRTADAREMPGFSPYALSENVTVEPLVSLAAR